MSNSELRLKPNFFVEESSPPVKDTETLPYQDGTSAIVYSTSHRIGEGRVRVEERLSLRALAYGDAIRSVWEKPIPKVPENVYSSADIMQVVRVITNTAEGETESYEIIIDAIDNRDAYDRTGALATVQRRYREDGRLIEDGVAGGHLEVRDELRRAGCFELDQLPQRIDFMGTVRAFADQVNGVETQGKPNFAQPVLYPYIHRPEPKVNL